MADIAYLPFDDDSQTLTLALESSFYPHDFDLEFPPSDQNDDDLFSAFESPIQTQPFEDDIVSEPGSVVVDANEVDFFDRGNQVNFVMDLFQERVEQSEEMGDADLIPDVFAESEFGVVEEDRDVGVRDLEIDLGLGIDLGRDDVAVDIDIDVLFDERRAGEGSSGGGSVRNGGRVGMSGDEEDEGEEMRIGCLGVGMHSDDDDYFHEDDAEVSVPLQWDSLRLEDRPDLNEEFEWEEVDGRADEGEVLSMHLDVEPTQEELERVGGFRGLEWEVLLDLENMDRNLEMEQDGGLNIGHRGDHIQTDEYEHLFAHLVEDQTGFGRPPASRNAVMNLPDVVITQDDGEKNNALCAICKDDISVGERAKQLPCAHRYHGECIVQWLEIRNTCPVCRHELPTDDAAYERRRVQRAGHRL